MTFTNEIIKSFIYCPYKSHLKRCGKQGAKTDFERIHEKIKAQLFSAFVQEIVTTNKTVSPLSNMRITPQALEDRVDIIINSTLEDDDSQLCVDILERVSDPIDNQRFSYTLVLILPSENITKKDKLFITCLAILLVKKWSRINGSSGKVRYGREGKSGTVKYEHFTKEAQSILAKLRATEPQSPPFCLNRHCNSCEFMKSCKDEALQNDHLSLLGGMHPKDIEKFNKKGIFTITQLSYTFRPRRRRNKPPNYTKPHSFPLQALAIREKKVYVHETPQLPVADVEIYVDLEGLSDYNFQYLIGVVVKEQSRITERSFWADTKDDEKRIFQDFLVFLSQYSTYTLFHYGSYETRYFKKMQSMLRNLACHSSITNVLQACCNILAFFYSNIYLPTYTNGLKDVAKFLGFTWSAKDASGLQSIVWRKEWEEHHCDEWKQKLIQYNREDCYALIRVKEFVQAIINNEAYSSEYANIPEPVYANELKQNPVFSFLSKDFVLPEMELIQQCSYFDYQKERVCAREKPRSTHRKYHKIKNKRKKLRVNKSYEIFVKQCLQCGSQRIRKRGKLSKKIIDLKFTQSGVKRWVTRYRSQHYHCNACDYGFTPEEYVNLRKYFGHNVKVWTIFQHIVNKESFAQIHFNLQELFEIDVSREALHQFKRYADEYYKTAYERLLKKILSSGVIYADETPFNLLHETVYAWVFTNGEEVVSMYRATREGDFLQDLLKDFKGILVSDFFQAYYSLDCLQQKCLIHLVRDFNEDLLNFPFDEEFKGIASLFTKLLQKIVKTIDAHGLQKTFLQKHKMEVQVFFTTTLSTQYTSEVAQRYQTRIEKNRNTLFTFIDYDNVSWNNTYAEHAIKLLATHRNKNIQFFRKSRMDEYLRIMSLYQTCRYKEISFLKFLCSQETDIDAYRESRLHYLR